MNRDSTRVPRRAVLAAILSAPLAAPLAAAGARAQAPGARAAERPLRVVLGFPPGSAPDVLARLLADGMREGMPAGIVVDNRPGAGGIIAAGEVARGAPADGSVLLFGEVGTLAMAPSTYARLPYDPARDFVPVAEVAAVDFALAVPANIPAGDFAAFLAWARARPSVFMGTSGAGAPNHFGASLLGSAGGLRVEPVHFRAQGDATTAILNGDVQAMFGAVSSVAPLVRSGGLRALLVTGPVRSPLLPEVPTVAEGGLPGFEASSWGAILAPSGLPGAVSARIAADINAQLRTADMRERMVALGAEVRGTGVEEAQAFVRDEAAKWSEVAARVGIERQ